MSTLNEQGTALITGASSGIGAIYAERLARRGYDLLLVARDLSRLQVLAARLSQAFGVQVEVLKADLTDKADLQAVSQRLRSDKAISVLVNNAGMAMNGTLIEADLDTVDRMILLNVVSLTHLSAAAVANFTSAGRGAIINIASVVALAPEIFNAVYSATKAYVLSLTQTMHSEVSAHGVQVQAVLPGITRTEIWERSGMDESALPPSMIMEVGEMVDAALSGFDQRELITIPSLPDAADWQALVDARSKLGPNLSHSSAAARYK
ncbi:MAG: SDR family oxidoreductase [Gammaproteobacteria bacterium]|nr:SDR family oxidoreductase [Gammaproteobacteria bacterium]MBU1490431.1 SDR family oxidoreductase [Gammaproteobacteria bacterium]MBU2140326.1 SDR family oxidoreductase [Gammaproteobacteria bacterium]MBU2217119.1 SDR family oxidoreductase [Gammaproteobacteria bacterium]MBU2325449.1 SDR family oxidoreductase [Gammaproteobacteria bacterium]